ncbi:MAG: DUF58 domain-containing protein [Clostridiales bacterium]|nr:DUF58 domain-containing protein [Clostridiales bacterium]
MLRNWIIYILALLGALAFFFCYKMWFSWYVLIITILILPVALLVSAFSALFFQIEADAFRKVLKGDSVEISFTSSGLGSFPFALYSVNVTLLEVMTEEKTQIRLLSQCNTTDSVMLDTTHCGTYRFTSGKVRIYDMFGLFFIPRTYPLRGEVVVLPVPCIPPAVPDLNGFKAKGLRKTDAPYSEIYDVREYMPGDPVKRIHWKLSAKKDRFMIREPQEETFGHSRVYLALSRNRGRLDRNLGEVMFTSEYFIKHDIPHKIRVLPPLKKEIAFDIETHQDLDDAILAILHMPIPQQEEEDEDDA